MSFSTPDLLHAAVVTISDSSARGEREDISGPAVVKALTAHSFSVVAHKVVPDEPIQIQETLIHLASMAKLVVTTGGTGIARRDVTPEATRAICDRLLEGIPERMRSLGSQRTPFAVLSRGICGIRGESIILNLPGNPQGAVDSLESVISLLPHALQLLAGNTDHS